MIYNSARRRLLLLAFYTVITLCIFCGTTAVAIQVMFSREPIDNRISATSDVLTAGTLLLAVVAGFIALQAFGVSTGLPKLQIQVWFDSSSKNRPIFLAAPLGNGWVQTSGPAGQTTARIRIRNRSIYPARDVAMIIELNGMALEQDSFHEFNGWWSTDTIDDIGIGTVQWDGGADFVIHGRSVRRVPDFNSGTIMCTMARAIPYFQVQLMASPNYRRSIRIPVAFFTEHSSQAASIGDSANAGLSEWL